MTNIESSTVYIGKIVYHVKRYLPSCAVFHNFAQVGISPLSKKGLFAIGSSLNGWSFCDFQAFKSISEIDIAPLNKIRIRGIPVIRTS